MDPGILGLNGAKNEGRGEPLRPDSPVASERPRRTRIYRHRLLDGERWNSYRPRDDDIIVCSAYKAGTTWIQGICALLVYQSTDLPLPLWQLSPWLDVPRVPIDQVMAGLDAQTNRRVVKSHIPLDGLPYHEAVTYLVVARDPRDIFVSLTKHIANMRADIRLLNGESPWPRDEIPDDPRAFFRKWLTTPGMPGERDGWPAWSVFAHAESFWRHRGCANIHLFHYADLKADLDGQMRRVSAILDIPVDEARWPRLVDAARFDSMKRNAEQFGPSNMWSDKAAFFAKGENRQWRGLLGEAELELYQRVAAERVPPDLAHWLESGGPVPEATEG